MLSETKTQALRQIAAAGPKGLGRPNCHIRTPTVRALRDAGLIAIREWTGIAFPLSWKALTITPAGRAALTPDQGEREGHG